MPILHDDDERRDEVAVNGRAVRPRSLEDRMRVPDLSELLAEDTAAADE